jgi:hypothetical protein
MGVGWIERIYNNTDIPWYIKSQDGANNGKLWMIDANGIAIQDPFVLDDHQFHELDPLSSYATDWCGIPWYQRDAAYKALANDPGIPGVHIYQSQINETNNIYWFEPIHGEPIGRLTVPGGLLDYHCNLRLENDGFYFDVTNDNGTTWDAVDFIYTELKTWAQVAASVLGGKAKAAGQGH